MIRNGFSEQACAYFASHAIDPATAWTCGVREDSSAIVWPTVDADGRLSPRRRRLGDGPGPRVRGGTGRTIGVWWPLGKPGRVGDGDVLVAEGESDALAAVCALDGVPDVHVVEGAKAGRGVLVGELLSVGAASAALGFDGDMAGAATADRIAWELVAAGVAARIVAVPHGEDLASVLARVADPAAWLRAALLCARPVGLEVAALVAEIRWLRARLGADVGRVTERVGEYGQLRRAA